MVLFLDDIDSVFDRGKMEAFVYAAMDVLNEVTVGAIDESNILYIFSLLKKVSLSLGDEGVFYASRIFVHCFNLQPGDLSFLRKVVLTIIAITETTGCEGDESMASIVLYSKRAYFYYGECRKYNKFFC